MPHKKGRQKDMELLIENLGKRYGQHWALRQLSLRCEPGMLGLVGPNGAGKTTLMRMIATLLEPTEGTIRWNGQDIRTHGEALRQVLGYLPQEFGIYPEFTGRQFLRYLAAMKGLPKSLAHRRVDEVLEIVNLEQVADRKLPTYSGGMKQRIGIAQALLNDPELLIVDEPTAGLDPAERVRFRTLLASLTSNRIIILSTHIISDVEAVANRLVILQEGRVLADTTPEALLATHRWQGLECDHRSGHRLAVTGDLSSQHDGQPDERHHAAPRSAPRARMRLPSSSTPAWKKPICWQRVGKKRPSDARRIRLSVAQRHSGIYRCRNCTDRRHLAGRLQKRAEIGQLKVELDWLRKKGRFCRSGEDPDWAEP